MIGVTSIACAITIAVGVNRSPSSPSGPARDSRVHDQTDDHGRKAHQRIQRDEQHLSPWKSTDRERGAERQADRGRDSDGSQAHLQAQQNDAPQRAVRCEDQSGGLGERRPYIAHSDPMSVCSAVTIPPTILVRALSAARIRQKCTLRRRRALSNAHRRRRSAIRGSVTILPDEESTPIPSWCPPGERAELKRCGYYVCRRRRKKPTMASRITAPKNETINEPTLKSP